MKLAKELQVGKCSLQWGELVVKRSLFVNEARIARDFNAFLKANQESMPEEEKGSNKVLAKSLRDVIDAGDCGKYSERKVEKNLDDVGPFLGSIDVGFSYYADLNLPAKKIIKFHYPIKKLLSKYSFTVKQLKKAGYSLGEIFEGGFSIDDLLAEGFTLKEFFTGGVPLNVLKDKFTLAEFIDAEVGVWALKNSLGFSALDLKKEGIGVKALVDGGFNLLTDLKPIFSINAFKSAGYGTWSLKNSLGYSAAEIKGAGFDIKDLVDGGFSLSKDLKPLFTVHDFKRAGYSTWSLKNSLNYSATEVKGAGFGIKDLVDGGFSLSKDLKPLFTVHDFKRAGYSTWSFKNSIGYTAEETKSAGFGIKDLVDGGYSLASDIKPLFTVNDFRAAGYSSWSFKNSLGYSAKEAKSAGFTIKELVDGGYSLATELKALYTIHDFRAAGYSAWTMKYTLGYSAQEAKAAGFTTQELLNSGYSRFELE